MRGRRTAGTVFSSFEYGLSGRAPVPDGPQEVAYCRLSY